MPARRTSGLLPTPKEAFCAVGNELVGKKRPFQTFGVPSDVGLSQPGCDKRLKNPTSPFRMPTFTTTSP